MAFIQLGLILPTPPSRGTKDYKDTGGLILRGSRANFSLELKSLFQGRGGPLAARKEELCSVVPAALQESAVPCRRRPRRHSGSSLIPPVSQDPGRSISRGTEAETALLSGLSNPVLAGPKGRSEDDYFRLTDPSILLTEWIQKQTTATQELGPQPQPGSHSTHAATPGPGTEAAGSPGSPRADLDKRLSLNNSAFPWKKQWHFPTWKRLLL